MVADTCLAKMSEAHWHSPVNRSTASSLKQGDLRRIPTQADSPRFLVWLTGGGYDDGYG